MSPLAILPEAVWCSDHNQLVPVTGSSTMYDGKKVKVCGAYLACGHRVDPPFQGEPMVDLNTTHEQRVEQHLQQAEEHLRRIVQGVAVLCVLMIPTLGILIGLAIKG